MISGLYLRGQVRINYCANIQSVVVIVIIKLRRPGRKNGMLVHYYHREGEQVESEFAQQ